MPMVVLYRENDGVVPLLEWLDQLIPRAQAKCRVRIKRLSSLGHQLRRPEADYLRDGIYELRAGLEGINYRMLYFFNGTETIVISHGLIKEQSVSLREIDIAIQRRNRFKNNPAAHTYYEEQGNG